MFETLGVASRAREIAMVMPRFRDSLVCAGGSVGVGWGRGRRHSQLLRAQRAGGREATGGRPGSEVETRRDVDRMVAGLALALGGVPSGSPIPPQRGGGSSVL